MRETPAESNSRGYETVATAFTLGQSDDAALMARVVGGDQGALSTLYDLHATRVYRVALRLLGDPTGAEDIVQETFLSLWDHAEHFDANVATLSVWLAAIARNRAVDALRRQSRRIVAQPLSSLNARDPDDTDAAERAMSRGELLATARPEADPVTASEAAWTRETLARAVRLLPEPERQVIELAYSGELSQSEIAARLGWPLGTVKTRTRRALATLRELVGDSVRVTEPALAPCLEPCP
jgi:RNA polymerase sigma-70 factor (ECF subfamily)